MDEKGDQCMTEGGGKHDEIAEGWRGRGGSGGLMMRVRVRMMMMVGGLERMSGGK